MALPDTTGAWVWRPAKRSPLDELINQLERLWGIDRLPRLVSPELAAKFQSACDMHAAGPGAQHTADQLDAMMMRAFQALDAAAKAAGAAPLPPGVHEIPLAGLPGAVAVICLDDEHAQTIQLRAKAEGRTVSTWTLAEIGNVISNHEIVNQVKQAFPGAQVRKRAGPLPQDDIPFGGPPISEEVSTQECDEAW